ncbi:NAD(P)H-binding protein [Deminuibacter soli]|uniref:NAD-dependent epimerase/dehydratase family protein n=1 Tax=Deminuibacter soli TaxID=2291815 RepID=A0A3E1NFY5_9BACT|nr:NAD(P)H-binding protein [Deminuibacter soli]RFM26792.1 NAD-dependent epimerase/dehydratase family protein [Deminuibacter soli]
MKTAIVIGATGMVGSALVQLLLEHRDYAHVKTFVRHSSNVKHPKLQERVVDFNQVAGWQHFLQGDVLFSCLGTTLKQAGSKDAQYQVDYTYQLEVALAAAANKVPVYVLVSASGASINAAHFYLRMKGALETAILALPFLHTHILRPGVLEGARKQKRMGELTFLKAMRFFNGIGMFKKFRPVHVRKLARVMIGIAGNSAAKVKVYEAANL